MTMYKQLLIFIFISYLTLFTFARAETGESIVLDPHTGDYIITYSSYTAEIQPALQRVVFVPATKIDPIVKSKFKLDENDKIRYSYTLKNGPKSRQNIDGLAISNTVNTIAPLDVPKNWIGNIFPNFEGNHARVAWSYWGDEELGGLPPGSVQVGFGFNSNTLPGIGTAELRGASPAGQGFPDEGPDPDTEVGKQFLEIQNKNKVLRPAAVPLIPVPTPFQAAAVLESLQAHVQTWVGMNLLDAPVAADIDRQFTAILTALNAGNTSAARLYFKDLRQLLKKHRADAEDEDDEGTEAEITSDKDKPKHKAFIDKLAAKVLVFDLKYIEKRLDNK